MSEPDVVAAWGELCDWVAWLTNRYRLTIEHRLPTCWPRHPELIEELSALKAWRAEAYGPKGSGQACVYWHQALITFLTNTATWWAAGCRAGHKEAGDLEEGQAQLWAGENPLAGITPTPLVDADVLDTRQMDALIQAGKAHLSQQPGQSRMAYYDQSWWVHAPDTETAAYEAFARTGGVWLRIVEEDLEAAPGLRLDPPPQS